MPLFATFQTFSHILHFLPARNNCLWFCLPKPTKVLTVTQPVNLWRLMRAFMNLSSSTSNSPFLVLKPESLPGDVVLLLIAVSITLFHSDIPNGLVFLNWTKKFFFWIFFKPLDGSFLGQAFCKPRCQVLGIVITIVCACKIVPGSIPNALQ